MAAVTSPAEAVTSFAACGVPATSAWSANDSALLTGASAADVEAALRDAAEQASAHVRKEVKEAKRSARKRRELAEHVLSKGGHALLARVHAKLAEHGVDLPSVQLEFRGVTVTTGALFGSAAVPTVASIPLNALKWLVGLNGERLTDIAVLGGPGGPLSGIIKPGRSTLLLGPPSCGKTTLMRVLAARLRGCSALTVEGEVLYNGHSKDEFAVERVAAFVGQTDQHIGGLTVAETLSFAHACQTGAAPAFDVPAAIIDAKIAKSMADLQQLRAASASSHRGGGAADGVGEGAASAEAEPTEGRTQALKAAALAKLEEDEVEKLIRGLCGTSAVRAEIITSWMGLAHVRDTPVGDVMTRGVSGGERKRVTCAEMLVGQRRVLLLDEINTGLDSATLHSVVTFLALMTRALKLTTVISLLQPSPEVVALFDDIMLMADGAIIYHGPVEGALPHFASLGLICPPRKDLASFLQEASTPAGQLAYASDELRASHGLPPRGADGEFALARASQPTTMLMPVPELVARFRTENPHGIEQQRELAKGAFPKAASHPAALPTTPFALSASAAARLVLKRQLMLVARDKLLLRARLVQVVVMGLIVGSLFFRLDFTLPEARSKMGAAFLIVMFLSMGGMIQVAIVMATRGVFYKHRDAKFYPAWSYGLSMALSQVPMTVVESVIFAVIVYWMIGFVADAARFFTFICIAMASSLCVSSIFRLIAITVPTPPLVQVVTSLVLLVLILTSGFTIVRTSIPPWWIWAYWISPFAWAVRAILINEFSAPGWQLAVPGAAPGLTIGHAALDTFGIFHERFWIWAGVAYLLALFVVLSGLLCFALGRVTGGTRRAQVPDPAEADKARADAVKLRREIAEKLRTADRSRVSGRHGTAAACGAPRTGPAAAAQLQPPSESALETEGEEGSRTVQAEIVLTLSPSGPAAMPDVSSSLPFEPITLAFRDLHYCVGNPAYRKAAAARHAAAQAAAAAGAEAEAGGVPQLDLEAARGRLAGDSGGNEAADAVAAMPELELLKGITGYVEPGQLMALMGGSGAGKTTLADVLCGRKTVGKVRGDIFVNGHPKNQATWARVVGYVEQQDIHSAATSVLEALWFSARLRLPPCVPDALVRAHVAEVLDTVELSMVGNALVGDAPAADGGGGAGLSAEQRKRLTIAVELVAQPSVVMMDEPTSGLDARSAAVVMRAIRNIGASGRTVLVTIHQPSIEIFEAFDSLLLLQRGGRTTYFGPLGSESRTLVNYLSAVPGTQPLLPGQNPASWMLEVTGGSMATIVAANAVDWPAIYAASPEAAAARARVEELVQRGRAAHPPLALAGAFAQSFGVQMVELIRKYRQVYWRLPTYNFARLAMTFLVAWIYATTYYQVAVLPEPASMASIQNVLGILFSSTNFLGMLNLMSALPVIGAERVVYYREQGAASYNVYAYGFALALVELPYIAGQAILFTPVVYFMVGFKATAEKFLHYFVIFLISQYFYTVAGQLLVWVTPSQQMGQMLGAMLSFIWNIANGFIITYPSMPAYWKWVNRLIPNTWILYGVASSQLGDSTETVTVPGRPPTTAGALLEAQFGYEPRLRWWCVLIVAANLCFYRVVSILVLRYKSFLRR